MIANSADTGTYRGDPDPDRPLTDEAFDRGRGAYFMERARAAAGLSQVAFARRYGIPLGSVRDWEQGRRAPDAAAQAFLRVIAIMPDNVAAALARESEPS